jgi:hypothetical protein
VKHNPFSTRKTNPGIIPYDFRNVAFPSHLSVEPSWELFYTNFKKLDYRSQIVGGHGTGKTTFLIEFVRYLENYQKHLVYHVTLHDRQRFLTDEFWKRHVRLVAQCKSEAQEKLPIHSIDGYEQLSLAQKMRLRWACRKGQCGLLITTHTPAWRLPVLLRTETTEDTLQYIIGHLFRDLPDIAPPDKVLCRSLLDRHHGNLRTVLFDLSDHYEESAECKVQSAK